MSKKKLILGSIFLVLLTMFATLSGVYYVLGLNQFKVSNTVRFLHALRFIDSQFVNEVSENKLITGAISGMMASLEDPHSIYLDPQMYKELMSHTEGSFGGVGIVMGVKDKVLTVVAPIEGTPSFTAGIKSGDKIVKINGEDTKELAVDQAANKIRGEIGTEITLTIQREGEEEKDYVLTRSNIEIKTVASKMLDGGVGYIRISTFSEHTGKDVDKAYKELEEQGMKAIVLDLRDNPGGLLNTSVEVANYFIPKGTVVSTIKRDGTREVLSATKLDAVKYPAAVLVNGGSASASEIVSGAIQDTQSGTIVGTKSYGKGSVQIVMPMYGGDALKLTIAKYYTPNDRSIDGIGIEPDVVVEPNGTTDNQLEKAIEIVKGKLQ
ncbi:S41 family peptidase [Anaerosinus massiliensis]|uniref:S41 family peptidase n=1 Tax=Massilibacillus massiliensis TaxID=1806837 RepID=UPI000A9A1BA3|nr:S41 family peptidase [Massilibacillus massiliensis]